jgi:hypothetical protein
MWIFQAKDRHSRHILTCLHTRQDQRKRKKWHTECIYPAWKDPPPPRVYIPSPSAWVSKRPVNTAIFYLAIDVLEPAFFMNVVMISRSCVST